MFNRFSHGKHESTKIRDTLVSGQIYTEKTTRALPTYIKSLSKFLNESRFTCKWEFVKRSKGAFIYSVMIGRKNYFPFGISIKFIPMNVSGLPGKAAILEVTLLSGLTMPHNPPPESDPYEHRLDIESIQWADVGGTIATVLVDAIEIKEQYHMKSIHVNLDGDSDLLDYTEKEIWNGIETGLETDDRFTIDPQDRIIRYDDSHIDY